MSARARAAASAPAAGVASRWRGWAMVAFATLGVAVSGYLVWVHYSGALALCAGAGGCETVQASRFATVAGVPVALLGLALYLALLGLSAWRTWRGPRVATAVPLVLFGLALAGTLYSAYLTYLELRVIGALCPWCVSSAVLVTATCALAAWDLTAAAPAAPPGRTRPARR
ncbi:MAG TPA: vitamin K epoxide reductase family protein [Chloroflexota bacterium]|nr:vitamin K epoxide reductase family protein [Chloroflexota bacterium]